MKGTMKNLYEILESTMNSTEEEIRKNYQRLILEYHPDKNLDDDKMDRFIEIDKAWKILRDEKSRELYNAQLKMDMVNDNPLLFGTYTGEELLRNEDGSYYIVCRCGGMYCVSETDLNEIVDECLIECDQCSLTICLINTKT